ncbi:hypothetical protein ANCDUO_11368, partial [Ancylostoma duodenale]
MRTPKAARANKEKESSAESSCVCKQENHEHTAANDENDKELSKMSIKEKNTIENALELLYQKIPKEISREVEAEKRARTVVISGIKEPAEGLRPTERSRDLKSKVHEILDALDIDCNISDVFRIGKSNGNRPRLVKL